MIVRNTTVRLIDVYKLSARKRPSSTAAAGGSGTKRPAGTADQDDRAAKRQQQQQPVKGGFCTLGWVVLWVKGTVGLWCGRRVSAQGGGAVAPSGLLVLLTRTTGQLKDSSSNSQ